MVFRALLCLTLLCAGASAQADRWFDYLPVLRTYLQLSDAQLTVFEANNNEYRTWLSEKNARIGQVQGELAEERARTALDPLALGVRYVELEAICRQIASHSAELVRKNAETLTPAQQARLKTLEEALALVPAITEAQQVFLLGGPQVTTSSLAGTTVVWFNTDRFQRTDGVRLGAEPACSTPLP